MNAPQLYHGSAYRHDILRPGIHHTGVLQRWDDTESNEWLYASTDRQEAILNGLCSALSQEFRVDRFSWDDNAFVITSADKITERDVRQARPLLYTLPPGASWKKVNNEVNGSDTEWKTKECVPVDPPEEILDPLGGRSVVILESPLERATESMSGFARFVFGEISVRIVKRMVIVSGVRSALLQDGMKRLFGTSTVANHLIEASGHSFRFHEFFLVDMVFILKGIARSKEGIAMKSKNTASKILTALEKNTWVGDIARHVSVQIDRTLLSDLNYVPKDFQDEFFDQYVNGVKKYRLKGFLFSGAAGSGKTFSGLALLHLMKSDQIVVFCPKNAVTNVWEDNIRKVFKNPPTFWTTDCGRPFTGTEKVLVIHYEYIGKFLSQFKPKQGARLGVLLDESHNLNELTAQRTQLFLDFCQAYRPDDVVWLSGTPIKALGLEAIPLLRCIDPLFDERAEATFRKIFRGDNNKAVSILRNRLGLVQFVVEKSRLGLAAPIFINRKVKFKGGGEYTLIKLAERMRVFIDERTRYYAERREDDQEYYDIIMGVVKDHLSKSPEGMARFEEYRRAVKIIQRTGGIDCKNELVLANQYEAKVIMPLLNREDQIRFKEVKTIIKYVHMKIQGECLGRIVGRGRIECHVGIAGAIDFSDVCESTEKKTVVFSSYVEVLQAAEKACLKAELAPLKVFGDTTHLLTETVQAFGADPALNPLLATYASLSTAVPLIMADTMVLIDPPFRDYILQQAVSRIHRLGADTQTFVHMVELDTGTEPNLSTRSIDILKWSQAQIGEITGVTSPFAIGEGGEVVGMESIYRDGGVRDPFIHYLNAFEAWLDTGLPPVRTW